jgi:hypothetical protein
MQREERYDMIIANMKRDMDLIRKLLIKIESYPCAYSSVIVSEEIQISDYTQDQINYHALLLNEAGLVEASNMTPNGSPTPIMRIFRLTWAGHEFLDSARDTSRWEKAKDLMSKIGGASVPLWISLLTELAKKSLGI